MNFKIGDKVRLKSGDYVPKGLANNKDWCEEFERDMDKIYTVKEADEDSVNLDEENAWFTADRFELVDAKYTAYHTALNAAEEAKEQFRVSIKRGDKFLRNDKPVTVVAVTQHYVIVRYDSEPLDIKYYATVEELRWRD